MKRKHKIKIFICSLIAWFVGMAVIASDLGQLVAQAASDDNLHHLVYDTKTGLSSFQSTSGVGNYSDTDHPVFEAEFSETEQKKYPYSSCFKTYYKSGSSIHDRSIRIGWESGGQTPVLVFVAAASQIDLDLSGYSSSFLGKSFFVMVSNSKFHFKVTDFYMSTKKDSNGNEYPDPVYSDVTYNNYDGTVKKTSKHDIGSFYYNGSSVLGSSTVDIDSGDFNCFTSMQDALDYLQTGDTSKIAWGKDHKAYSGDAYLDDFEMIVHDSNAYSAYYIEFRYKIPTALQNCSSLKLDIAESFEWVVSGLSSLITYPKTSSGTNIVDLLQNPTGFKMYLDDIDVIQKFVTDIPIASTVSRRAIIGSEIAFDTSGLSIGGLGGETVVKVTNSKLYLDCYVVADGKYGQRASGSVDFIYGSNSMASYTPDESGNYKYNDDYRNQGHYYTEVSTDAAGNTTYNYYYYGTDNSKTEISSKDASDSSYSGGGSTAVGSVIQNNNVTLPDHIFVTVNGSSGGSSSSDVGNVTIEDDDLSFDSLRKSIKDGYGLIDDTDTGKKNDGLVSMMSDLFAYLPGNFVGLIMLGTSSVVGIAIIRMIVKR